MTLVWRQLLAMNSLAHLAIARVAVASFACHLIVVITLAFTRVTVLHLTFSIVAGLLQWLLSVTALTQARQGIISRLGS